MWRAWVPRTQCPEQPYLFEPSFVRTLCPTKNYSHRALVTELNFVILKLVTREGEIDGIDDWQENPFPQSALGAERERDVPGQSLYPNLFPLAEIGVCGQGCNEGQNPFPQSALCAERERDIERQSLH